VGEKDEYLPLIIYSLCQVRKEEERKGEREACLLLKEEKSGGKREEAHRLSLPCGRTSRRSCLVYLLFFEADRVRGKKKEGREIFRREERREEIIGCIGG